MIGSFLRLDGEVICDATVNKYMDELNLKASIQRMKKTYKSSNMNHTFDNLIKIDFKT